MNIPYFWLGAEALEVCTEYTSQLQRDLEAAIVIDTSDIDE